MLCDPAVQTNQVVRRINNLNLTHSPEVVVPRRGQLQKKVENRFLVCKYQWLRLEGEVDRVGSGPSGKCDIKLQGNGFSRVNFSVALVHRLYRRLTVARLPILRYWKAFETTKS